MKVSGNTCWEIFLGVVSSSDWSDFNPDVSTWIFEDEFKIWLTSNGAELSEDWSEVSFEDERAGTLFFLKFGNIQ